MTTDWIKPGAPIAYYQVSHAGDRYSGRRLPHPRRDPEGPLMTIPTAPRSAVETAIDTHYIAGLHFWTRTLGDHVSVVCSNALGAVEYRIHTDTGEGANILHSPDLVRGWADDVTLGCPVQGGRCYEGHSAQAFRELLLPLLDLGDFPGVLNKLAEIHGGYFRSGLAA